MTPMHIRSMYFVGIKGVGMTPLAVIAKQAGIQVRGSDLAQTFITDTLLSAAGIKPDVGFDPSMLGDVDFVVATGAHGGMENPQVKEAMKRNIRVVMQGQAVGMFMQGEIVGRHFTGISVSGSHGKTTTTAMIATIFQEAGLDPSYIIGTGTIPSLPANGYFGSGEFFIAEADEYATDAMYDKTPKFLWQHPKTLIVTNIELDHPDLYDSVDSVRAVFLQFAKQVGSQGNLIICGDQAQNKLLLQEYQGPATTYGFSPENDVTIAMLDGKNERQFRLQKRGQDLGTYALAVPGDHNVLNATAAILCALAYTIPIPAIQKGLQAFLGTKRRFEYKGILPDGAMLYDDYAHHPTEIATTLKATRQRFPDKEIVCIFQPHTYSRTKKLLNEFAQAFSEADEVILTDIYPSAREDPDPTISSQKLAELLAKKTHVFYAPSLADVVEYISRKRFTNTYVLITMGAGDIYTISEKLGTRR